MNSRERRASPFGRALQNVGWLLTGKGVGAALSLVYLGLATRSLGIERFGQFMLILSTAQGVASLVSFQSWQVVVRYGVALLRDEDAPALGRLIGFCAVLDLGAGIAGCAVAAIAIEALGPRLGWSVGLADDALIFSCVLLLSVRSTAVGIIRLHDRFGTGAAADTATPIVRFLGALAAVAAGASVRGFLIAWAAAEVATAIAYWTSARRVAPGATWHWRGFPTAPREHPGLWHFAAVSNLNATMAASSRQIVVVVVGLVAGPAAAGAYRLAFQLSQSLARLSDMFSRGIFPEFTRAHATDGAELQRLFRQSTRLTVAVGAAICVLAPLLGQPILHLVGGKAYASAYPLLLLLSLAAALDLMGVGFEPVLLGTGRAAEAFRIRLAGVAMLMGGALALMPPYGAIGAAAATLLSSAVTLVLFGQYARAEVARRAEPVAAHPR